MFDSMHDWMERYLQRQRDLERGVDADRVQANRRKRRLSNWSFACGCLLLGVAYFLKLPNPWRSIALTLAAIFSRFEGAV